MAAFNLTADISEWKKRNIFFGDKQMITLIELEKIVNELCQQKNISFETQSCAEVSSIVYRSDHFKYGSTAIKYRHIDIEFEFGEYCELCEEEALYQYIFKLCNLDMKDTEEEAEAVLYKKQ